MLPVKNVYIYMNIVLLKEHRKKNVEHAIQHIIKRPDLPKGKKGIFFSTSDSKMSLKGWGDF